MVARALLAAVLLPALAGCGGDDNERKELRLLAPVALVGDTSAFERATGCRIDLRVYDANEDIAAIARRRNVDVVARPARPDETPHDTVALVRITLDQGLDIVVPVTAAPAFGRPARPAGRRATRWEIRDDPPNPDCARRWFAYATAGHR
jgi:hypothetical protein